VAPERGLAGDLMPDNVELAMMKKNGPNQTERSSELKTWCL
jgi:hypothetical protein